MMRQRVSQTITRSPSLSCWLVVALIALGATQSVASTRYDPRLRFRTVSTARFDIHFHQGEEALARRLAAMIEAAASEVDAAVGAPAGRVQVILVDQHDLSNGWATPIPYNTIEISVAPPTADSGIGNTDQWLRLVFVHEYTHIAHLSRSGGWIGGLRRAFGRYPLLFPNLYQPIWGIEGIATWQESVRTADGRVSAGDFRLLLDRAAAANRFEPLDRANGGNVDWPSGATPYLYGAYFHQFLADRYGADSIRTLAAETGRRLPYFGSRAYKKVYGRSLGELWNDFEAATKSTVRPVEASRATRLTNHGFTVSVPRISPSGTIFYSSIGPHRFPALMEISPDGTGGREVARRYLGGGLGFAGEQLVVDELDLVRSVGLKSDLYLVDPRTGERRRLTRDARAADPDVSRDGRTIVCTVARSDRRALATLQLPPPGQEASPQVLISEENVYFAGPRWSPDGRWIVAERRQDGGPADIVLIDVAERRFRLLANLSGGRAATPAWMPDGARVLFSAAVDEDPFSVYGVDVATGTVTRLEGTGASAQSPAVSSDGHLLVYIGYTPEGYDLFSLPLGQATWTPVSQVSPAPPVAAQAGAPGSAPGASYSPWRTLRPQFWTPTIESDADEVVLGAATGSADVLGRHAYGVEAGWSNRARPDWRVAYAYDRWRPTLFAAYADDTDPWRAGEARTRELDAGMLLPISRVRYASTQLAALHVGDDVFTCPTCAPAIDGAERRVSLRTGWEFSSARSFGYSISAEEGGRVGTTMEISRGSIRPEAGSARRNGGGVAVTADARYYWRTWPRHGVIAIRGAAAGSWGDAEAARVFSASGNGPQSGGFAFGTDAIGLLRGFDEGSVTGTSAAVLNADYRAPLVRIDRGVGTAPIFLRSIHGAVFVDVGHAWTESARWSDSRASFGVEISADAVVGFALPLTFTAGGAWRRDGTGAEHGFVLFGRIGRAF
jgi:hypothetical protein